ncbi:NUDIX hydrolase [Janibacter sp. GXQ6167]|uniref:NUDIX hydrolase n=1 Tax=Janibacter sp. GXQ6167 TaxID=3240791 RepID=UPI003524078F
MATRDFSLRQVQQALLTDAAARSANPAEPRLAATVMLVRDGDGVEVFMQRRVASMAFAPSMHVFPGGGADPRDAEGVPWAGPTPSEWAELMGLPGAEARMLVAAAVRELYEEAGVLLASPEGGEPAPFAHDVAVEHRRRLVAREVSFGELLREEGLVLRSDLLRVRARWISPAIEPRRYDTWFFVAQVPPGQTADDATSEVDHAAWAVPREILARYHRDEVVMLPPTVVSVEGVGAAPDVASLLMEPAELTPVLPVLAETADGPVMRIDLP